MSIARPVNVKVGFITSATNPEMYNQFATPMMENLCELMQEEMREFLDELTRQVDYPIEKMTTVCSELGHHVKDFCQSRKADLVVCDDRNHSFFSCVTCSAKGIAGNSGVSVLLVSLEEG